MVFKKDIILGRLKELDTVVGELNQYTTTSVEQLSASLSLRWTIERGLIAGATLILDIADHILSAVFGIYPDSYEGSLKSLKDKGIISQTLYSNIKGLGGLRNILVHEYLKIDLEEVHGNLVKALEVFPRFSLEIQRWLESVS